MESKFFEVRDISTFIPVLVTRFYIDDLTTTKEVYLAKCPVGKNVLSILRFPVSNRL